MMTVRTGMLSSVIFCEQLEAAHVGHLEIRDDQVVAAAAAAPQRLRRRPRRCGRRSLPASGSRRGSRGSPSRRRRPGCAAVSAGQNVVGRLRRRCLPRPRLRSAAGFLGRWCSRNPRRKSSLVQPRIERQRIRQARFRGVRARCGATARYPRSFWCCATSSFHFCSRSFAFLSSDSASFFADSQSLFLSFHWLS